MTPFLLSPLNPWAAISPSLGPRPGVTAPWAAITEACLGAAPWDRRPAVGPGAVPLSVLWVEVLRGCCFRPMPRQRVWTQRPGPRSCGPPGLEAVLGAGAGGPGPRFGMGEAILGAQTLSLSLPGDAPGGAAWPRRPCGECPVLFPVTCTGVLWGAGRPLNAPGWKSGVDALGWAPARLPTPPLPSPGRRALPCDCIFNCLISCLILGSPRTSRNDGSHRPSG